MRQVHASKEYPFLSDHDKLSDIIRRNLNKMSSGGHRLCIQCKRKVYWYQEHCICLSAQDTVETCASNISKRLLTTIKVDEVTDPATPISAFIYPFSIIQSNPLLWSQFLMNLWMNNISYLIEHRHTEILNCRRDEDWKKLRIHLTVFLEMVHKNMQFQISKCHTVPPPDMDDFILSIWKSLSGMFCLYKDETTEYDPETEINADVFIYQRSHFRIVDICGKSDFVKWLHDNWRTFYPDDSMHFNFYQE